MNAQVLSQKSSITEAILQVFCIVYGFTDCLQHLINIYRGKLCCRVLCYSKSGHVCIQKYSEPFVNML